MTSLEADPRIAMTPEVIAALKARIAADRAVALRRILWVVGGFLLVSMLMRQRR